MYPKYFRFQFENSDDGYFRPPEAQLNLGNHRLIGDCVTAGEFDYAVDRMIKELEGCKRRARKKFTAWENQDEARRREYQLSRMQDDSDGHTSPHDAGRTPL